MLCIVASLKPALKFGQNRIKETLNLIMHLIKPELELIIPTGIPTTEAKVESQPVKLKHT